MSQLKIYTNLSLKDVFNLWSATQLQVIIIAGICLPILMLLGLHNGIVTDLRKDLEKDPMARCLVIHADKLSRGDLLTPAIIAEIEKEITNIELFIPDFERPFTFISGEDSRKPLEITLRTTLPGDPELKAVKQDVLTEGDQGLVLSKAAVDKLKLKVGDTVTLVVTRGKGAEKEEHSLHFVLRGIKPGDKNTGNAHLSVMNNLQRYIRGAPVPEWNIAALPSRKAEEEYAKMLLFCSRGEEGLTENDFEFFKRRNLTIEEITNLKLLTLYGILAEKIADDMRVYEIRVSDVRPGGMAPIDESPKLLMNQTNAVDDLILRWNEPLLLKLAGREHRLVGVTLPIKRTAGWFHDAYGRRDAELFVYDEQTLENPYVVRLPGGVKLDMPEELLLEVDATLTIPLSNLTGQPVFKASGAVRGPGEQLETNPVETETLETEPKSSEAEADGAFDEDGIPIAFVPARLLAYLHQFRSGTIAFDETGKKFIEKPTKLGYSAARIFVKTIDDVIAAYKLVKLPRYNTDAHFAQINRIKEQDNQLSLLVKVVALGVFLFGVITVFSVMVDSTDRKKGTIGILRVMGTTKFGIFYIVLFRAITIGLLAAIVCSLFGIGLAYLLAADFTYIELLAWKPIIKTILYPSDVGVVALGAILCAALGAVLPAFKASHLDPFEAIVQGQY